MIDETLISNLPKSVQVYPEARMSDYTTFRLGGSCRALLDCKNAEDLAASASLLAEANTPFIVIGQGSNLLVSDQGIDVVVLRYCAETHPQISFSGCRVNVSGSTLLDELARQCIEKGLGDISFCSGIPGTVGGAVAGNAGAFGRQIGDVIESAKLMAPDGTVSDVSAEQLGFSYRTSALKQNKSIILEAVLKLKPCDISTMRQERARIMDLRRAKHPNWESMPCAGSIFRNIEPSSAAERRQAAGWFLEQSGARDLRVGGAYLFEKHANIIIAESGASASEVNELMSQMTAAVQKHFGFKLEPEVLLLGEF